MNDCVLCGAVKNSLDEKHETFNTPLLKTENFVVLPCVGPLVIGQVMVVGIDHYPSLALMGKDHLIEFYDLLEQVKNKYHSYTNILLYEHGSSYDQTGGSCIVHTHIHLIPQLGHYYNLLDGILPELTNIKELRQLREVGGPYIMTMNNQEIKVYQAYNAHSQMMRKALCDALNRTDWDWAESHNEEVVQQTIDLWK